jgi:archaellum component FlaC
MSKIDTIQREIERTIEASFPRTDDRKMSKAKGSPSFIRHQFIDTINNIKDIKTVYLEDKNKFKQLLDKAKQKYENVYEEIENAIYEMEDRIYNMAKSDYAIQNDIEDEDEVFNDDIPGEMIAEFISEEWHHNMENRYDWAKDYFPDSRSFSIEDHDPINDFLHSYVYPIEEEINEIYKEFININKSIKDNIRKNYNNIYNYIFEETPNLIWERKYRYE